MFLYFKFLERDGNRGLGLLPLYSLDWIGWSETPKDEIFLLLASTCNYCACAKYCVIELHACFFHFLSGDICSFVNYDI